MLYLALFAAAAFVIVHYRHALADNAKVIKVRLNAVVGAAANRYFELVRKLYIMVAFIKPLMNFI